MAVQVSAMELAILIRASSQGFGAFKKAEGGIKGVVAAVKAMSAELAALAVARGFAFFGTQFQEATRAGRDFSEVLGMIAASSAELDFATTRRTVGKDLRAIAKDTIFTATESGNAFIALTQSGLGTKDAMDALIPTLNLAALGQTDMGTAADILTNVMIGLKLGIGDLSMITDVMTATYQNANTSLVDLGQSLKFVTTLAEELEIPFADLSAALGTIIETTGVKGTKAGTQLRKILLELTTPASAGAKALQELGVQVFDASGKFVGLGSVIDQMNEKQLTTEERLGKFRDIIGVQAIPAFLGLINSQEKYNEILGKVTNSSGLAQEQVGDLSNSYDSFAKIVRSSIEEVRLSIFDSLEPALRALGQFVKNNEEGFIAIGLIISEVAKAIGVVLVPIILVLANALLELAALIVRHEKIFKTLIVVVTALSLAILILTIKISVGLSIALVKAGFAGFIALKGFLAAKFGVDALSASIATLLTISGVGILLALAGLFAAPFLANKFTPTPAGAPTSFQSGTGPAGVPRSGLFFLHKGEQVFNPQNGGQSPVTNNNNQREVVVNVTMNVKEFEMDDVIREVEKARFRLEMG